jgi:hypothetical protein
MYKDEKAESDWRDVERAVRVELCCASIVMFAEAAASLVVLGTMYGRTSAEGGVHAVSGARVADCCPHGVGERG